MSKRGSGLWKESWTLFDEGYCRCGKYVGEVMLPFFLGGGGGGGERTVLLESN